MAPPKRRPRLSRTTPLREPLDAPAASSAASVRVVGGGQVGARRSRASAGSGARPHRPGHEVGEHRAGVDRGELVGVADQHQPGVRADRLEQPRHHRQRHHRGLVDDHDVVGQPVGRVVPEAGRGCRAASRAAGAASSPSGRAAARAVGLLAHRLLQPGGGLAGRRGQRDPQARAGSQQQLQQPRDGVRLAGAGPAGDDAGPAGGGDRGGEPLPVRGRRRRTARPDRREQPPGRPAGGSARGRRARARIGLLLLPVAVEVEQRPSSVSTSRSGRSAPRTAPTTSGLRRSAATTRVVLRPGQRATSTSDVLVAVDLAQSASQLDADRAEPDRPHGERRREQHRAREPSRPSAPSRRATCTSAAASTPASLKTRSSPVAPRHRHHARPASRSDSSRRPARPAAASRRRRSPAGVAGRPCRARTGTAPRRGAAPGRSRAGASAGSGAARRSRAAPAAGSARAASPRPSPRGE